jgi:hypothetical protein
MALLVNVLFVLFLMYKKEADFHVLILYTAALLNILVISFLLEVLEFSTKKIIATN